MKQLTLEQFKEFAEELKEQGFPVNRLDFANKDIKYSDDIFKYEIIKGYLGGPNMEKMDAEQTILAAVEYVEENIPEQYPDEEIKYSDETYDMWISAFTYAVMFWKLICKEVECEIQ